MNRYINAIFGLINIFIGGMIYILWRKQTLLMFTWFKYFGIESQIVSMRNYINYKYPVIPTFVCYSLPNGLWVFGGLFIFSSLWGNCFSERNYWMFIFVIISVCSEFAQLLGLISGTYDNIDLVFIIIPITLFLIIDNKQKSGRMEL